MEINGVILYDESTPLIEGSVEHRNGVLIVQTTGDSLIAVMSQDAATRLFQMKLESGVSIVKINGNDILCPGNLELANKNHTHKVEQISDFPTLSDVATSGDYNDLENAPEIPIVPENVSAFNNDAGYVTEGELPHEYDDTEIKHEIAGKYTKPLSGIPKTDLASDVQTSLGKADSALQTETDPTVPSWAKQQSKPAYNASEVGALPAATKYGDAVDVVLNTTDYKLTITLKDQDGNTKTTKTVDFPIESVVVNGSYYSTNQKIVLTLQNGNTIDVPVGDLVAGLQSEITSQNMLDADLVDDSTSQNKFVTDNEKQTWNSKSNFSGSYNDLENKPTLGTAAALNVPASGNAALTEVVKGNDSRLTNARTPTSHTHTSSEITDLSGTNDGTNWTSITIGSNTYAIPSGGGGGLSDYDFTELSAPTISGGAATVTFVANQRNCVEMSTNADLALAVVSNNKSDNYIWITNTHGSNSIDVTFSSIKFGSTTITNIKGIATIPSIDAGETMEIGIYISDSKARITSRIL